MSAAILWGVWGNAGMYSDHSEWLAAVYVSKEKAEEHMAVLQEEHEARKDAVNNWDTSRGDEYGTEWYAAKDAPLEHDPMSRRWYEDAEYSVYPIYLTDSPKTFANEVKVLEDLAKSNGWVK